MVKDISKKMKEKIKNEDIYCKATLDFLPKLRKAYKEEVKRRGENKKILAAGISAGVGFIGCASLVLAPPLMAIAVAAEMATGAALGLGSAGLGSLGAAAGGGITGALTKFFEDDTTPPELDPDKPTPSSSNQETE